MELPLEKIKELIQSPKSKKEISTALAHEGRLRFHTQTDFEDTQDKTAQARFLSWVQELIPEDKYLIFRSLFRFPIKTVSLTEEAFAALEKVFDGRDPSYTYNFENKDLLEDWKEYQKEKLNEPNVWREDAFEVMKADINSVMVVDLPREQEGDRPEPYFYFLSMSNVIDFCLKPDKCAFEYLIFSQPEDRVMVIDENSYRTFTVQPGSKEIKALEHEATHDLGYCPARFFWTTSISRQRPAVKRSPITNHLGALDWFLFFAVSKQHLDLYAPYPIYSSFAQDCDYEYSGESGMKEHCDRGLLRDEQNRYIYRGAKIAECPACSKKRLTGVGSFVEIDPPSYENNNTDLRNPVSVTPVDGPSLEYNTSELKRLGQDFFERVTGYGGQVLNDQALNMDQIGAFFEGRTNTLRNLKKDFESAQAWVDKTCCLLRYGDRFKSLSIDYGSTFYLLSADDLLAMYTKTLKEGGDSVTLDTLQDQYYETRFRNNAEELERAKLLLEVEPLRHLSKEQVQKMYDGKSISYEDYMMKLNFSSLIMRFERENVEITEFAENSTMSDKVNKIRAALLSYIQKPESVAPIPPAPAPEPGPANSN